MLFDRPQIFIGFCSRDRPWVERVMALLGDQRLREGPVPGLPDGPLAGETFEDLKTERPEWSVRSGMRIRS